MAIFHRGVRLSDGKCEILVIHDYLDPINAIDDGF